MEHDLKKFLDKMNELLPPQLVKTYIYQITSAIKYCHSKEYFNR